MMISTTAFAFIVITLILTLLGPVILLLIMQKGRHGVFSIWIAGALGFYIPQMVIRLPVLQFLGTQPAFNDFARSSPYIFSFLLAFSAALFETSGRFIVLGMVLNKRLSWMTGLAAGAGHGGIESIFLVGLTYINNLVIAILLNRDRLSLLFPHNPEMAEQISDLLVKTPSYHFLLAGFERWFTIVFHITLSVLLTCFLLRKQAVLGFFLVFLLHSLLDFAVLSFQYNQVSLLAIEGLMLIVAGLSLSVLYLLRRKFSSRISIPADPGEEAVREGY